MKVITITLIIILISTPILAFEKDKQLHFAAGSLTYSLAEMLEFDKPMLTILAVGIGKEIYDSQTNGTVELKDVLATILGGMFAQFTIRW
jgi:hypothetical protein